MIILFRALLGLVDLQIFEGNLFPEKERIII